MSKVSLPSFIIALLVVLILLTYMCTFQVAFHQVGIKKRLGQADEHSIIREPGLRLKWPPPIESVQLYDTRLQTLDTPEAEMKTVDGKQVIVGTYAVWRIEQPLKFYNTLRTMQAAERYMKSRIATAQAAVIGQSNLSDFVNLDAELVNDSYEQLLGNMKGEVAPGLLTDYGVNIVELGIRRISLPKETTGQIFEAMRQERNKEATRYREEGKSEAAAIVARASAEADQIMAFAERRAQEILSAGYQAAARILAQIEDADSEFFEWLRWLDALKASLSQKTTIFIDQDSPLFAPFVNPPVDMQPQPGKEN